MLAIKFTVIVDCYKFYCSLVANIATVSVR